MPYYTGNNVPLKFTCAGGGSPITPTSAKVTIQKPDHTLTTEATATINADEVSYSVPTSVTDLEGLYRAYFVLTLASKERTHHIIFEVKINP